MRLKNKFAPFAAGALALVLTACENSKPEAKFFFADKSIDEATEHLAANTNATGIFYVVDTQTGRAQAVFNTATFQSCGRYSGCTTYPQRDGVVPFDPAKLSAPIRELFAAADAQNPVAVLIVSSTDPQMSGYGGAGSRLFSDAIGKLDFVYRTDPSTPKQMGGTAFTDDTLTPQLKALHDRQLKGKADNPALITLQAR